MTVESAADVAAMFDADEFAVTAIYTPSGCSPISITLIVDKSVDLVTLGESDVSDRRTVLTVQNVDVSAPARGDTWTVGATVYTFERVLDDDGIVSQIVVE